MNPAIAAPDLAPFINGSYAVTVVFLIGVAILTFTRYRRAARRLATAENTLMRARKKRRLYLLLACGVGLGSALGLSLAAFSSTLTYFLGPAEVAVKKPAPGMDFRLGGIVQVGTVNTVITNGTPLTNFRVTDGKASIPVTFTGVLPDLFREGQGVVAIGAMTPAGNFSADEVLAKHGASYMPRDVEEALKDAGKWNPKFGPPPAAATWNTMTVKSTNS